MGNTLAPSPAHGIPVPRYLPGGDIVHNNILGKICYVMVSTLNVTVKV